MQRQPSNLTQASSRRLNRERSDLSDTSAISTVSRGGTKIPAKKKSISSIVAPERLKASLKEKETKIEQLLKEREMERAQTAKAASQTDEAESHLEQLRDQFQTYKQEQEERAATMQRALEKADDKIKRLETKVNA